MLQVTMQNICSPGFQTVLLWLRTHMMAYQGNDRQEVIPLLALVGARGIYAWISRTQNPALESRLDNNRSATNAVVRTMRATLVATILPC